MLAFAGDIYRIVPLHAIGSNSENGKGLESTSNTPSTTSTINNIPALNNTAEEFKQ
jgi:hypothetical protein